DTFLVLIGRVVELVWFRKLLVLQSQKYLCCQHLVSIYIPSQLDKIAIVLLDSLPSTSTSVTLEFNDIRLQRINLLPLSEIGLIRQTLWAGTLVQFSAVLTIPCASIRPNPNLGLYWKPASFIFQPGLSIRGPG
ncbi:hypothetical protein Ocin01_14159, partial [Orchesella cincta]